MEEKKLDVNTIIGFVLIFGILLFMFWQNQPTPEEIAAKKAEQEQIDAKAKENKVVVEEKVAEPAAIDLQDSTAIAKYKSTIGAFGFTPASDATTLLENNLVAIKISNKGGQIVEVLLKAYKTYDSIPVYLVKDGNSSFALNFSTSDNRVLNTKDLFFEPALSKNGNSSVLSMKAKVSNNQFLEYRYEIKPDDYMVDFAIKSQGLNGVINSSKPINLDWKLKAIRHSKSIQYENRYSRLTYNHEDGKISKLSDSSDEDEEIESNVKWISYRQHFFSSILATNTPFETARLSSKNLVKEESHTQEYMKEYSASEIPLKLEGGELAYSMNWYYGPTDVKVLAKYENLGLEDSIPFGWGIFGWINRYFFTPLFTFLSSMLPAGVAIIVMTILVRLAMSPVTYKSYLSQAKMKVLKPEIAEINEKYKDNAMKRQQETMKLNNKAGVSPLSGCIPALIQMPIFYALFSFFPTSFALRQKSFLWADDLSSYDTIAQLPFTIPLYGDHVSLFPILASIAIFFYMMMTTGQNMTQQPGMPNMKFIMYLSPVMMLVFFNGYASGLSLYYFISNLITIFIMLAIKNFILDDAKIHAQIQENKLKPKKENKFQRKMREMMEQAEAQKNSKK